MRGCDSFARCAASSGQQAAVNDRPVLNENLVEAPDLRGRQLESSFGARSVTSVSEDKRESERGAGESDESSRFAHRVRLVCISILQTPQRVIAALAQCDLRDEANISDVRAARATAQACNEMRRHIAQTVFFAHQTDKRSRP